MNDPIPLETDYTLAEVARALRMSTRWVREQIKAGTIECTRRGHKIVFTAAQVEQARKAHAAETVVDNSITTGRKKAS